MGPLDSDLRMARRHVYEGEHIAEKQRKIVDYLRAHGHPVELAEALLVTIEGQLLLHREHLARISEGTPSRGL